MIFSGYGKVWDIKKGSAWIQFIDGKFETDDERVIDILKNAGFQVIGDIPEINNTVIIEPEKPKAKKTKAV